MILLDEYERWTGDASAVRLLERVRGPHSHWIDEYGDIMGDGYVWYQRRNETTGLENQCWKDSWDSISYRDGRLPGLPRATCELQGYAYDAKIRGARLAREFWNDPAYADRLEREAAELKERFNRDFWVEDGEYYALALDADGGQVDALSSNIGHLLWSGIVDQSRAAKIAEHLLGPRLFSGWGVRTLAKGEARYNPHRLPRRHRLALRQLVHRLGTTPLRLHARGSAHRRGHHRRRRVLRRPPAGGLRRI